MNKAQAKKYAYHMAAEILYDATFNDKFVEVYTKNEEDQKRLKDALWTLITRLYDKGMPPPHLENKIPLYDSFGGI